MILTTKDSPFPPHSLKLFLYFCDGEEEYEFKDFQDDFKGIAILEQGNLDECDDVMECSVCGPGSVANIYVVVELQKPNFGGIGRPKEELA